MSFSIESITLSVSPQMILGKFSSAKELDHLIEALTEGKYPEQRHIRHPQDAQNVSLVLCGSSRSAWLQQTIESYERHRQSKALSFLSYTHSDFRFPVDGDGESYGFSTISILDPMKIDLAIAEIASLIEWAKAEPLSICELMPGYERMPDWNAEYAAEMEQFTTELVFVALRDETISIRPSIDIGEEGTGPEYLFGFLRTLNFILFHAKRNGECVIHYHFPP